MTYKEAMESYGSDKPDIRFDMKIQDISDLVKDCGFSVFTSAIENGGSVRAIVTRMHRRFTQEKKLTSSQNMQRASAQRDLPM